MCLLRGTDWICNYLSGPLQEGRAGNAREPSKQYTFSFPPCNNNKFGVSHRTTIYFSSSSVSQYLKG